jgi:NitT/TauT family transport system substrate-binding protein
MTITRRTALAALGSAALAASGTRPRAQDFPVLRFGVSTNPMTPGSITQVIGEYLGYNKEEGFRLVATTYSSNPNVMNAFDRGEIDVMNGTPAFQLPLFIRNEIGPFRYYFQYGYPYKWDIAVLPDSPLKAYEDLKGKTIGVSQFGSSEYPVTKALLKRLNIDPDHDVTIVAVGQGALSGDALRRRRIDALAYYDYGFGLIEGTGLSLRMLARPADLPLFGGNFLTVKPDFLKANRKLVVGYGRSNAKAAVFVSANPVAAAKAYLALYPDGAPRGLSPEDAAKTILPPIERRLKQFAPPYPGTKLGYIRPQEFVEEAKILGLPAADFSSIYTNDLIDEINDFDAEKIKDQARRMG